MCSNMAVPRSPARSFASSSVASRTSNPVRPSDSQCHACADPALRLHQIGTLVAAFRPQVPVLVFCESAKLARQLQLHRAIHPVVSQVASVSYDKMAPHAVEQAVQLGLLQKGDSVVIVSIAGDEHATADMKIWTV